MSRAFDEDLKWRLKNPEFAKEFGAAQAKSSLALTLAEVRQKVGVTQGELAGRAGVSQSYIAKLEGGEANPTIARIGSLLSVMGMSLTTGIEPLSPYPTGTTALTGATAEVSEGSLALDYSVTVHAEGISRVDRQPIIA